MHEDRKSSIKPTNPLSEKSQIASRTPFYSDDGSEQKKQPSQKFYDSWFALFLDVIFAVKPQPYILFMSFQRLYGCVWERLYHGCAFMIYYSTQQLFTMTWSNPKNVFCTKPRKLWKNISTRETREKCERRSCRDKKRNLFKRWKSWPRHNCRGKELPELKNWCRTELPCAEH